MKIELHEISVRDVAEGYIDHQEEGVFGYSGKLNIRPKYQREFIYKDKKREAVILSVQKEFPLNVMYWVKNGDSFEVLDGQQRIISICQYIKGNFAIGNMAWNNLTEPERETILNYKLMVYFCEGNDREILDWFEIINIAGMELTAQEMRNAVYTGAWLTDAKRYFSKTNCASQTLAKDYVEGEPLRQKVLETVLKWISNGKIEKYMSEHQHDANANELWLYFQNVIAWVKVVFPKYRKIMDGLPWGEFYNEYKDKNFDSAQIEKEIAKLMADDEVENKKGIYAYILDGKEKHLSIRSFTDSQKQTAYEKQKGKCRICKKEFKIEEMEGDHIKPWSQGGKTEPKNLQMLCKSCNREKSAK